MRRPTRSLLACLLLSVAACGGGDPVGSSPPPPPPPPAPVASVVITPPGPLALIVGATAQLTATPAGCGRDAADGARDRVELIRRSGRNGLHKWSGYGRWSRECADSGRQRGADRGGYRKCRARAGGLGDPLARNRNLGSRPIDDPRCHGKGCPRVGAPRPSDNVGQFHRSCGHGEPDRRSDRGRGRDCHGDRNQ